MEQYANINIPIALNVIYVKFNINIVLHILLGAIGQNLSSFGFTRNIRRNMPESILFLLYMKYLEQYARINI